MSKPRRIAVDFDGTCVDHRYPKIGPSVPGAARCLRRIAEAGHGIILWTMRSGDTLEAAKAWFAAMDIPLFAVNDNPEQASWTDSRKVYAHAYIDDAALGTPVVFLGGFVRACVDWEALEPVLQAGGWFGDPAEGAREKP